ncbi:cutinase family protein (plasmid) [Rhodococcus sp. ZPP]|uniref:cutinase family protein n=1 Tax=Rhodococcus sp. ZPP TaxID=2749906 RepID=UPI001AD85B7D|nr:cutinase family protein [Rhodococcus sp. ZPP]QTJ71406.1 cutinase family protein [Rhodococcus sp. ZPP]
MIRRIRSSAAVAVTAALVSVVGGGAAASAAPGELTSGSCAPYMAVLVPGTWETNENADPNVPVGMLAEVGKGLKDKYGSRIRVVFPAYPASAFDKGKTYTESEEAGVAAVNRVLEEACATTQILLAGYSQGAHAAGDVASSIGNGRGPVPASQVKAVGLVADPKRGPGSGQLVGPTVAGTGIAGTRPGGFGQLASVTRQMCSPGDLYCATDADSDGMLGSIGRLIGNDTGAVSGSSPSVGQAGVEASPLTGQYGGASSAGVTAQNSTEGSAAADLVSDFSQANLAGVPSTPEVMRQRIEALPTDSGVRTGEQASQIAGVGASAASLIRTLAPLQDVAEFAAGNASAVKSLTSAPADSPQAAAAQVLDVASKVDLAGLIKTAGTVSDTVSLLLSETSGAVGGDSAGQSASPTVARTALSGQVDTLTSQLGPLGAMNPDTLSTAASALSVLKPSTLINQVLAVGSNIGEFAANLPGIGANLVALPQRIAALDVDGAHRVAGELNNLFSPLVKMAAVVDFHTAAQVMALIPDPSGYTQIAAMVLNLLGNLDVIRLANNVGQAQEVAWAALKNPDALAGLLPIGLDLASVATGVLSGGANTDPSQLGAQTQVSGQSAQLVANAQGQDLVGLGGTLTSLATSEGAQDLVSLAKQGLDAASFYASGAHQSYGNFLVDGARTALQWLLDFFTKSLGGA